MGKVTVWHYYKLYCALIKYLGSSYFWWLMLLIRSQQRWLRNWRRVERKWQSYLLSFYIVSSLHRIKDLLLWRWIFFSNNARSHWSFQGHMIPIMTCQRIPTSSCVAMPGKGNLIQRGNTCARRHHYPVAWYLSDQFKAKEYPTG